MTKIIYNKLVRDNIINIIKEDNKQADYIILNNIEYKEALKLKVIEEAKELYEAKTDKDIKNELSDIIELLETIISVENIDPIELESIRLKKSSSNGKFKDKLYLKSVTDNE